MAEARKAASEADYNEKTMDDRVAKAGYETVNSMLENIQKMRNIELTEAQTKAIAENIAIAWYNAGTNRMNATTAADHVANELMKITGDLDIRESKWAQTSPPFIVWVLSRDTFDANQVPQVKLVRNGSPESIEAIERCQSGFNIHLFTKRTSDLACYREMWALLSRLRLAMRYALNTTANYRTDSGYMN